MLEGGAKTPQAKKKPRMPYKYDEKKKMDAPWRLKGTSDCAKELHDEDLDKDVYDFRKCGDKDFVVRGRKTTGGPMVMMRGRGKPLKMYGSPVRKPNNWNLAVRYATAYLQENDPDWEWEPFEKPVDGADYVSLDAISEFTNGEKLYTVAQWIKDGLLQVPESLKRKADAKKKRSPKKKSPKRKSLAGFKSKGAQYSTGRRALSAAFEQAGKSASKASASTVRVVNPVSAARILEQRKSNRARRPTTFHDDEYRVVKALDDHTDIIKIKFNRTKHSLNSMFNGHIRIRNPETNTHKFYGYADDELYEIIGPKAPFVETVDDMSEEIGTFNQETGEIEFYEDEEE